MSSLALVSSLIEPSIDDQRLSDLKMLCNCTLLEANRICDISLTTFTRRIVVTHLDGGFENLFSPSRKSWSRIPLALEIIVYKQIKVGGRGGGGGGGGREQEWMYA